MVSDLAYDGKTGPFLTTRTCYIFILAAALFPLVIRKELQELKIASVILFLGISSFILIFTFQLLFEGNFDNLDDDYDDYWVVNKDLKVIKGFAIFIVAFSF